MNFCTEIRGHEVQVLAVADRPYPQAPMEVEILAVTMAGGGEFETTAEEDARLRDLTYAKMLARRV